MKKWKIWMMLILCGTLTIQSCKDDDDDDDYTMDRTLFVSQAASGNMLEIQSGQLAVIRGTDQRVRDFGQMMITDHTAASAELATLATSKSIAVPTGMLPAHKQQYDALAALNGVEFDKQYANLMVQSHQEQVNLFDLAEDEVNDSDFRRFADNKLPTLEAHLNHARQLNQAVNP